MLKLSARDQMRRLADVLIACALLVLTLPLMFLIAAAIKLESPGPVLERHSSIGYGGRRFQIIKFRTMPGDPEGARPHRLRQPTPLGEFLRLTRIEALPQLINVLRGEMSMIEGKQRSPSFLD
jgi:lipopolysaccharide/colanic/teichoic acid biosynthesis glycosyltransferase